MEGSWKGAVPLPDVALDAAVAPDLVLYQVGVVGGGDEVMAEWLVHVLPQCPVLGIEDGALHGAEVHEEPISTQHMASPGCRHRGRFSNSQGQNGRDRMEETEWGNRAAGGSQNPQTDGHGSATVWGTEKCCRAVLWKGGQWIPKLVLAHHGWSTFYTKMVQEQTKSHLDESSSCARSHWDGAGNAPAMGL